MESIDFTYGIVVVVSTIIVQIGLIIRRKIIEEEKRKRVEIFKDMNDSKINAIGNYEEKSKSNFLNK